MRLFLRKLVGALAFAVLSVSSVNAAAKVGQTAYPGGKWSPSSPTFGVASTKDVMVTMRDGVKIPVDVHVPADPATGQPAVGKFPVLLTRFWYTKGIRDGHSPDSKDYEYFVRRGYVYVSADVRGTGRSLDEGSYLGERDALDGVELVRWVRGLPASNGVIGLIGCSAMGQVQLTTAAHLGLDSGVKAMIPACVPGDQYRDTYTENGVWRPTWQGLTMATPPVFGPGLLKSVTDIYLESQQGKGAAFDGDWWAQRNFVSQADEIAKTGAAILVWNGWQDVGFGGMELFAALQNAAQGRPIHAPVWPGSRVTGRIQLIVGDWKHGQGLDQGIQLQWFETWLKGKDTGLARQTPTPIHAQDRITKEWLNLASYPIVDHYTALYLGQGTLTSTTPALMRKPLAWGRDSASALDYFTTPYPQAMRLAGPISIRLSASSSQNDAQFRFELFDVAPDGTSALVSHGMILGSMHELDESRTWRDHSGKPVRPLSQLRTEQPISPGDVIAYEVQLEPTLWTLRPGHRLHLRISTQPPASECPMFPMISDKVFTGCILRRSVQDRLEGATFTVFQGGTNASFVNLPLTAADTFRAARSGVTPTGKDALPLDW